MSELNVVTGAFGYSGKYITRRLLSQGKTVRTLTGHAGRPNPFGDRVSVAPFSFDNPGMLTKNLEGAEVLFNTYWIRFAYGDLTFNKAVENTKVLFQAAREAGVPPDRPCQHHERSVQLSTALFPGKGALGRGAHGFRSFLRNHPAGRYLRR